MTYEIDWIATSAMVTALSTLALTIITAYYARSTRHILNESARQAAAAERTVEMLLTDQSRRSEQYRAPLLSIVDRGLAAVGRWQAMDLATAIDLDSRDLEVAELPSLILDARAICFPFAEALSVVESLMVQARFSIDELVLVEDEDVRSDRADAIRIKLQRLNEAWLAAKQALHGCR